MPPPSLQSTLPVRPQLSAEEEKYVQELISMPFDSILDNGSGEKNVKTSVSKFLIKLKLPIREILLQVKTRL